MYTSIVVEWLWIRDFESQNSACLAQNGWGTLSGIPAIRRTNIRSAPNRCMWDLTQFFLVRHSGWTHTFALCSVCHILYLYLYFSCVLLYNYSFLYLDYLCAHPRVSTHIYFGVFQLVMVLAVNILATSLQSSELLCIDFYHLFISAVFRRLFSVISNILRISVFLFIMFSVFIFFIMLA